MKVCSTCDDAEDEDLGDIVRFEVYRHAASAVIGVLMMRMLAKRS